MPDRPQTWIDLLATWPWLAPALVGGIIGLLRRFRRDPDEPLASTAKRILVHLAQALFAGWLVQSVLIYLGHEGLVGPAAALAALMGSGALDLIEDEIQRRARRLHPPA